MELVKGGVYWVRPSTRDDGVFDEPTLAKYNCMKLSNGVDHDWFDYFGTDWSDRPGDVIMVAGPLEIPPPPSEPGTGEEKE